MESLDRSRSLIELGRRIVAQLKLGDDLLSQWMAHHIAERIDAAERADNEERASAQDACARAIFQFWDHRNTLPEHIRPFRALEPLIETLASLDVSDRRFRYFQRVPSDDDLEAAGDSSQSALALAMHLDEAARVLIQYFLASAAEAATEDARPWIEAAIDSEADAVLELRIVEFVSAGMSIPGADEAARRAMTDKMKKLEMFSDLAKAVALDLKKRLDLLNADNSDA
jgi:hypothetical protein